MIVAELIRKLLEQPQTAIVIIGSGLNTHEKAERVEKANWVQGLWPAPYCETDNAPVCVVIIP